MSRNARAVSRSRLVKNSVFRKLSRRAGLYILGSSGSALVSLVVAGVAVKLSGPTVFAQIAIGASLGGAGAILVQYGWDMAGPALLANRDKVTQKRILAESVAMKAYLTAPVLAILAATAALLGSFSYPFWFSLMSAFATGLSAPWFYVGVARPGLFLACETCPRLLGTLLGILLSVASDSISMLLLCQLLGALIPVCIVFCFALGEHRHLAKSFRPKRVWKSLGAQRTAATSMLVTSLYVTLPVALLHFVAPGSVASFAALQRVHKLALAITQSMIQTLQGWVPNVPLVEKFERMRTAVLIAVASATVLGFGLIFLTRPLLQALTDGVIQVETWGIICMAATVVFIAISGVTGLVCLAALNRMADVMRSTIGGACVGVVFIPILGYLAGASGAYAALAIGEGTVLALQIISLNRAKSAALSSLRQA